MRLIKALKRGESLYSVKPPKGATNLYSTEHTTRKASDSSCLAIPDSRLLERKTPEELVESLKDFDVISFDAFDTLVFRPFCQPVDMFYLLETKLKCFNFVELRIKAEQIARAKTNKPNYEVDVYDIYEQLSKMTFLKREDAEKEIETEKEVCYANPYMLEVFKLLKKAKKTIVVNSDMYLPSRVIKEILEKNGFVGIENIYVSCEVGINKASGKLFDKMKKEYAGKSIIHIGDSVMSDVDGGSKAGLSVYHYQQFDNFFVSKGNLVNYLNKVDYSTKTNFNYQNK